MRSWRLPALGLLLLLLTSTSGPARAGETVAVVFDRSGSLRYADPQGEGPRALAAALALSLEPDDRLAVILDPELAVQPQPVPGLEALAERLREALSARPRLGGSDLAGLLARARQTVGQRGVVVVFSDDDLDVVGLDGSAPTRLLQTLAAEGQRPTRRAINQAALAQLRAAFPAADPAEPVDPADDRAARVRLIGLVAKLPPGARQTPFLAELGATVVPLDAAPLERLGGLCQALSGHARLTRAQPFATDEAIRLELPYPAQVVALGAGPLELAAPAHALDGDGLAWGVSLGSGQPLEFTAGAAGVLIVAPQGELPGEVRAYALRSGALRVVVGADAASPGGDLVARAGGAEAPLQLRSGPWGQALVADVPAPAGGAPLFLLEVVEDDGRRAVAASRRLQPVRAELKLKARGEAVVDLPLALSGPAPAGLPLDLEQETIRISDPGGSQGLSLIREGDELVARLSPKGQGKLSVSGEGELSVSLEQDLSVQGVARHRLRITALEDGSGQAVSEGSPLAAGEYESQLQLLVKVTPPLEAPAELELELAEDSPPGLTLTAEGPLRVQDEATLTAKLSWETKPRGWQSLQLNLKGRDRPLRAVRRFALQGGRSLLRLALAIAALLIAVIWFVLLLRFRKRRQEQFAVKLGERQLRSIGSDGKLTVERYRLNDFVDLDSNAESLEVEPLDSGKLEFEAKPDGSMRARTTDHSTKLVHGDRPDVLVDETTLRHKDAFAVVQDRRARRYVYLESEPTADDLQERFVGDTTSYESNVSESGVYVVLDDDENLALSQETVLGEDTTELFPPVMPSAAAPSSLLEHAEYVVQDSDVSARIDVEPEMRPLIPPPSSQEEILFMDSDEAALLDSDDAEYVSKRLPPARPSSTGSAAGAVGSRPGPDGGDGGDDGE